MRPMDPAEIPRAFPLLRGVPADELRALGCERVERAAGEAFFQQGTEDDHAYGVLTGRVRVAKHSARGRELVLEIVGDGELFGAIAVLRRLPMPAACTALEATAAGRIPGEAFRQLLARHPTIAARMLETISRRLMDANHARLGLATEPVDVRLARALLRMAAKFGAAQGDELVFSQTLTRQNLADLAGTTVESTIRTLSRWTKAGLLRSAESRITIVQPEALRRLAESDDD